MRSKINHLVERLILLVYEGGFSEVVKILRKVLEVERDFPDVAEGPEDLDDFVIQVVPYHYLILIQRP